MPILINVNKVLCEACNKEFYAFAKPLEYFEDSEELRCDKCAEDGEY